jgi:hypothetical protein
MNSFSSALKQQAAMLLKATLIEGGKPDASFLELGQKTTMRPAPCIWKASSPKKAGLQMT